ncbi:MAG: ABC transporter permease subunit [Candidatus Saccharimonadales bacterium]
MLTILKKEIWDRKNSLLAYCLIGLALLWLYVALFPSIKASSVQLEKLFQSYPKALYQALGVEDLSFGTLEKFLSVELFSFMWPILAIIFAISRAGNTLVGEIEKGTMGLYLSLPVSRVKLFLTKCGGGLISSLIFVVATIMAIIPMALLYSQSVNSLTILKLAFISYLFMWAIFAVTACLSVIFSERSKVYMVIGGSLLVMYAANVVASLKPNLSWLHKTSVFYYYSPQEVLTKGHLRPLYVLLFAVIIIVTTVMGALIFDKRDISV